MKILSKYSWLLVVSVLLPFAAFAEEGAAAGPSAQWAPLGVGLGIAIAVFGAAFGQGRIAAAFMDGVSRNPGAQKSMFTPLIISLAFVETLVLFAFLIVNNLLGKVGHL
jgi:F-type H+-transporting ATPase subunit c